VKQAHTTHKEPLMIRTTITTLTLTAITMIALATASPALAASSSNELASIVEPVDSTCVIDTELGTLPCPDRDWSLGGLSDTGTTGTDRNEAAQPTTSTVLRAGHVLAQTGATSSTTVGDSFIEEARIRSGRPDDTIGEDVDRIMDTATRGVSILSLDHMMIGLAVVLGLIGVSGVTTVVLVAFVLGRKNR